tara:strand:- start:10276 stop:10539 length:264 start_codon:yes stop_codon:yes gene_type:complete
MLNHNGGFSNSLACYKAYCINLEITLDAVQINRLSIDCFEHLIDFARNGNSINGIEKFWRLYKRVFIRYNGIGKKNYHLSLKEKTVY